MSSSCRKKVSVLLQGITSKPHGGFFWLNCPYSFETEDKLESRKNLLENKDLCNILMPSEDTKILEFNQNQEFDKPPFTIYADLECLIEKTDGSKINH